MVDESGKVAINSPETIKALQYARELYQTFIPGTESWLDINNNRVFLAGDISVTANGVSLYYSAKNDPKMADMAKDIRSDHPADRAGRPAGGAAPDDLGRDLQVHQVPERGQSLSAVHARQAADGRLDHRARAPIAARR